MSCCIYFLQNVCNPISNWRSNSLICSLILLYDLYDETKDFRYKKAIKTVADSMHFWPWNPYGGYWHMMLQPNLHIKPYLRLL